MESLHPYRKNLPLFGHTVSAQASSAELQARTNIQMLTASRPMVLSQELNVLMGYLARPFRMFILSLRKMRRTPLFTYRAQ